MTVLNNENAVTASTIRNIKHPDWGVKKFNYQAQPLNESPPAHTFGQGSDSAVLDPAEMSNWEIMSFKEPQVVSIELGNIGSKEQAEKIIEKLSGKTYYDFKVDYGVYAGNYPVTVSTEYAGATEGEVKDMLLFLMAGEL